MKNKYFIFLFLIILMSCSNPGVCPAELNYDPVDKLTTLNEEPYTGRCSVLNEDGGVRSIQQYLNGYDYGKWTFYYSNGNIETKGKFINGKRAGKWRYFHSNGKRKQISKYSKDGERNGKWSVYDTLGKLIETIQY